MAESFLCHPDALTCDAHPFQSGGPRLGCCLFTTKHFCPTNKYLASPKGNGKTKYSSCVCVCVLGIYAPLKSFLETKIHNIPTARFFFFLAIMFMTLRAEPETSSFRFIAQSSSPRRLSSTACYACRFKKVTQKFALEDLPICTALFSMHKFAHGCFPD